MKIWELILTVKIGTNENMGRIVVHEIVHVQICAYLQSQDQF